MMLTHLKEIRESNDLTQQDVADEIGVSKGYYSLIENGKRGLSYVTAQEIAAVFGLKPDDIFLNIELTKSKHSKEVS